jgi:phosphatidate phosphatase APP1
MQRWLADVLGDAVDYMRSGADPYEIVAYRGFANDRRALVHGRVLESPNVGPATAEDSLWRNLVNTLKRVESDPVSGARVLVVAGGHRREVLADNEGFFREWIDLPPMPPSGLPWREVELRLIAPLRPGHPEVRATARLRVPEESATFGVISDIDDTVIQSRIANFLQAVRTVMLGNSRTRLPFPGVGALYEALQRGGDGKRHNPIFYVSSSPWNIYDVIADFMEVQLIPPGPILLRDWDINLSALSSNRLRTHKEPLIREILDLYPSLPFVLIGDNSQKDPEIYRSILDRYPGRILAIYIRNVDNHPERSASLKALAEEVLAAGSTLVLADDSYAAAVHAADHGWITRESVPSVLKEEQADEGESGTKADVPGVPEEAPAPTVVVE